MRLIIISITALILMSCTTSAAVCQRWRNKEISDKKAAKILGISPARTVVPPDKAPDVVLSDGTRKKGEMIVTYQADFVTEVSCTAIEEGWVKPIPVWTWGK